MKRSLVMIFVILGFIPTACAPSITINIPQATTQTPVPDVPTEVVPTALPVTATYEGCAYVWSSQDLPELSRTLNRGLNAELQQDSQDVSALAYAYGESCIYGDGHETFSAMETDFRIGVKVSSVKDEAALGNWIFKIMPIIQALPADEIQGPQPGRVDFDFKQPDPAEVFVTVPIDKYRTQADNLRGAELFRLFYTKP